MSSILEPPKIVSRDEWNEAREALLVKEKELTKAQDKINAERRKLPMVRVEKEYTLEGPDGPIKFQDLFNGRDQLIVRHLMFHPDDEKACPHCSFVAGGLDFKSQQLRQGNISLIAVSRAPYKKLEEMGKQMSWKFPWYSSYGSDFNYDFNATQNDGECATTNVFLKMGKDIYQTYWTAGRGLEQFMEYGFVDATPLGRQEKWEEPEGRAKPLNRTPGSSYPDRWV